VAVVDEPQEFPVGALTRDGEAVVIWHDFRNGERDVYGQRLGPHGEPVWEAGGRALAAYELSQGWPAALEDPSGVGVFVLWGDARNGPQTLYAQRFDREGRPQWASDGVPICVHAKGTDDHVMAPDGAGGFIAVWEDWRAGKQDIYAQRVAPDGRALWAENGVPVCDAPGDQYDPAIAPDGQGGIVVTWWDVSGQDWKVVGQRVSAAGARMWGSSGVRASASGGNQAGPVVAGDGRGGAYLFWADFRDDDGTMSDSDVYGQHISATGAPLWDASGMAIAVAPGLQQHLAVAADGEGGAYVVWVDPRDVFDDIYVQRVHPDGAVAYAANGLGVCLAEGRQREPKIVVDGGALWIAWYDYRRESDDRTPEDIALQRLDPAGRPMLGPDGVLLVTDDADRNFLGMRVRDGRVLLTWAQSRGENDRDVHAWFGVVEPGP
jgi:hypothetical protein